MSFSLKQIKRTPHYFIVMAVTMVLVGFLLMYWTPNANGTPLTNSFKEVEAYHPNGNLSYHYATFKNRKHGLYKEYYPNGKIQILRYYHHGEVRGEKILDINGSVLVNYKIKNGRYYGLLGSLSCFSVFDKSNNPNSL